jgi:predicted nucleic acid-binding protein
MMKIYADSSVIVSLIARDSRSEGCKAAYMKLGRPRLMYTPLHELEVGNALRLRSYLAAVGFGKAGQIKKQQGEAEGRLQALIRRQVLVPTPVKWEEMIREAMRLSERHTMRLGTRALDIQQVAAALVLNAEVFITADVKQARLAKAMKLEVVCVT